VRFVALGDVHGSFSQAAKLITAGRRSLGGKVDAVLCVGDLEANRNARDAAGVATGRGHKRWVGEFPRVLSGEIELGAPLWFIGGDHEPWATLDSRGPGEIYPELHFLGRAGVRDVAGLKVGFLSGVRGAASGGDLFSRMGRDERACYVEVELIALARGLERAGGVDVLVTHDWPTGMLPDMGSDDVRQILDIAQAKLHICGHRHMRRSELFGTTHTEALADVLAGKKGWASFVRKRSGLIERIS
jgi:lariat debranching enzyme